MFGKHCLNTGVAVGRVLKEPDPSEEKKLPHTVSVEMLCTGVIQLTTAVLETAPLELAWIVSLPLDAPV
jgi:hypothetical protein